MLEFEQNFFLGETRDGFYIEPMMKCVWAAQLEVLDVIARVCNKHNIRWFADWGTLLGAVRHQGFVPWDDDMDICMFRKDYERFLEIASSELPDEFTVLSPYTNDEWPNSFMRVINAQSISYESERLRQYHGCPYVVGIDIFPLDGLPKSETDREAQRTLVLTLISSAKIYEEEKEEIISLLPDLEQLSGFQIDRQKSIPNQLLRAANHVCRRYNKKKMDTISMLAEEKSFYLKSEWYRTTEYLDFENVMLPCPGNYEAVLTALYGEWRTPVRNMASHDYPFYNKQTSVLREELTARIMRGELL